MLTCSLCEGVTRTEDGTVVVREILGIHQYPAVSALTLEERWSQELLASAELGLLKDPSRISPPQHPTYSQQRGNQKK